ncbi:hypothetical protein ACH41E_18820 [Streptomyces sp. NPDC020412]|uniref:hypothetical protein n=1 Tax=Streptomyces sp. NPDC020412 TaxID=3365073 RepID=UPI003790F636
MIILAKPGAPRPDGTRTVHLSHGDNPDIDITTSRAELWQFVRDYVHGRHVDLEPSEEELAAFRASGQVLY